MTDLSPLMTAARWWHHLAAGNHRDADALHGPMLAALPNLPTELRAAIHGWLTFQNRRIMDGPRANDWRTRDELRERITDALNNAMDAA